MSESYVITLCLKTGKARLNASSRLNRRQKFLVFIITVLTVLQIGISVLLISLSADNNHVVKIVSAISIVFSALIALLSNTESISKDALHSHVLHECGIKLLALHKRVSIPEHVAEGSLTELSAEYDKIIAECSLNHEPIDYKLVLNELNSAPWYARLKTYALNVVVTYGVHFAYIISIFAISFILMRTYYFCVV